jgi:hypothetical protein
MADDLHPARIKPVTPREESAPDGRIGWPDVVQYRVGDYVSARTGVVVNRPLAGELPEPCTILMRNEFSIVPPLDGRPFTVEVLDLVAYQALSSAGRLSTWPHRARTTPAEDNRRAPA